MITKATYEQKARERHEAGGTTVTEAFATLSNARVRQQGKRMLRVWLADLEQEARSTAVEKTYLEEIRPQINRARKALGLRLYGEPSEAVVTPISL